MPLGKKADAGDYIDDFKKSKAPQFKGKSQKKRKEMVGGWAGVAEEAMHPQIGPAKRAFRHPILKAPKDKVVLTGLRSSSKFDWYWFCFQWSRVWISCRYKFLATTVVNGFIPRQS